MLLAQLDKDKNQQDIRFLIVGYYLELQKLRNQKQILQHNMQQTDKLLQQIRNKFKQGVALKNAVTRYELQKQSLDLALLKLENSAKAINNDSCQKLSIAVSFFWSCESSIDTNYTTAINWVTATASADGVF